MDKAYVRIVFAKDAPHALTKPLAVLYSEKARWWEIVFFMVIFALDIWALIYGNIMPLLAWALVMLMFSWRISHRLCLYDGAIVQRILFWRKTYYLNQIDWLESYNIEDKFSRITSQGYRLWKDGAALASFPKNSFKEIDLIASVYACSPYAAVQHSENEANS